MKELYQDKVEDDHSYYEDEIEWLREALRFYADEKRWQQEWDAQFKKNVCDAHIDGGEIARAALKETK